MVIVGVCPNSQKEKSLERKSRQVASSITRIIRFASSLIEISVFGLPTLNICPFALSGLS